MIKQNMAVDTKYTVVLNYCIDCKWNAKGTGINMDFYNDTKNTFDSIEKAIVYIKSKPRLELLNTKDNATYYVVCKRNGFPEKSVYFYRGNLPKESGYIV